VEDLEARPSARWDRHRLAALRREMRTFLSEHVAPEVAAGEASGAIPWQTVEKLGQRGYLIPALPRAEGGAGFSWTECGILLEELGRCWTSLLSVVTAHSMVRQAVNRWGRQDQQERCLAQPATGTRLLSFALSEPGAGSDTANVETVAEVDGSTVLINGSKVWVSGGQFASDYLVLAASRDGPVAVLVPRSSPGLRVTPMSAALGFRAAMLARLEFEDCRVAADGVVGPPGAGFSHVAATALDHGRFCFAWGAVGLMQACLEACESHTRQRFQFGVPLIEHQLIRRLLSNMVVQLVAARSLCQEAGRLRDEGSTEALIYTSMAKYFAATSAARAARDAVQVHGASGCSAGIPVERYFRDAKILEIIEGTNEIHQATIARHAPRFTDPFRKSGD
jgi:glutaryl-CoA dehydrogenase (non-decarboxylating)